MLASERVWRLLESTRDDARWNLSQLHLTVPAMRLSVGGRHFAVSAGMTVFDADLRTASLVRSVTVTPDSPWLRRSTWYRSVRALLGKPSTYKPPGRGTPRASFARKVRHSTRALRAEMDLVAAAVSPPDPRWSMLAALPLAFEVSGASVTRRERVGRATLIATINDHGAMFFAWNDRGALHAANHDWSRRAVSTLERAGYRDPGDTDMLVHLKFPARLQERARLDAVLDRALRDAK